MHWYVCIWYLIHLGTYITFWGPFIGYIYHWGFLWDLYESCCFLLLEISMHLECSDIMWEFFEILLLLDHGWGVLWVWEMSDFLLGSLDHFFLYHSIISVMTLPSLHWYGLIITHFFFSMAFYAFPWLFFLILILHFIHFLYRYTFLIRYPVHIILLIYW